MVSPSRLQPLKRFIRLQRCSTVRIIFFRFIHLSVRLCEVDFFECCSPNSSCSFRTVLPLGRVRTVERYSTVRGWHKSFFSLLLSKFTMIFLKIVANLLKTPFWKVNDSRHSYFVNFPSPRHELKLPACNHHAAAGCKYRQSKETARRDVVVVFQ